jgi:hypothetical protein
MGGYFIMMGLFMHACMTTMPPHGGGALARECKCVCEVKR